MKAYRDDELQLREQWLAEEAAGISWWDFSRLDGRVVTEPLPWDYRQIVEKYLKPDFELIDLGTGGGEFLLSLHHPYDKTHVTEAYPPNIELCLARLTPLGIKVREAADESTIPYADNKFDIVLSRHESLLLTRCTEC